MTYRCGMGPLLGNTPPTITCDALGCDAKIVIDGDPSRRFRFLSGKAQRGWYLDRTEDEDGRVWRRDYCCKAHRDEARGRKP